jgi:PAS domain S-box-containing protein
MHRLLERQIKRALDLDPEGWPDLAARLQDLAARLDGEDAGLAPILAGLPGLLSRVSDSYAQQDRDLVLVRRSLELSSTELTDANQRLLHEAQAMSQALATLQFVFHTLRKEADGAGVDENDMVSMADKIVALTSQQEETREALRKSEERFHLAMRGANDGLWDWDLDTGTVYFSPRWKTMLGHAPDEIGHGLEEWSGRLHPDERDAVMGAVQAHLRGDTPHLEIEFRFRHKDGHYLWILSRGQAVKNALGRAVRLAGTHIDITQRVELQRKLAQFKDALDEHAIVSITDAQGRITYANEKFCQISGYEQAEVLGRNHRLLKSGQHPEAFYRNLWDTIAQGRTWSGELCNRAKDGRHYWVLATISPILGNDGLPEQYIAIRADISRIKEAEAALKQAKDAAESANRAKSEFLANMSHEIRTPMNGVLGMLNLALDTPLDDEQREYLSLAQSSADALLHILNDILDLSKIEAGRLDVHPDPVELAPLLTELGRFFEPRCREKGLDFHILMDPELPRTLMADPVRLRQVLTNLLSNAVKFTHAGSIRLDVRLEAGWVCYAVADTGIGIPPERQAQVFEAFTQADGSITRRYGGTGLGLTISSRLARLMGGRLDLESVAGQGSEFRIHLPLLTPRPASASEAVGGPLDRDRAGPGLAILVAEDNAINQRLFSMILERAGHRVTLAENGQAALDALAAQRFDLVLMDMQMPGMGGLEATRHIRAGAIPDARDLPIVALTANAYPEDRERCLAAGMNGFVTKPLKKDELFAAIAEATGRA